MTEEFHDQFQAAVTLHEGGPLEPPSSLVNFPFYNIQSFCSLLDSHFPTPQLFTIYFLKT